jgi:hypothetical protein
MTDEQLFPMRKVVSCGELARTKEAG